MGKYINSLRVESDCDIYITGSNAKLLSGELVGKTGVKGFLSMPLLEEMINKRERGAFAIEDAMKELGKQSRSTFYRRVKEFKDVHRR